MPIISLTDFNGGLNAGHEEKLMRNELSDVNGFWHTDNSLVSWTGRTKYNATAINSTYPIDGLFIWDRRGQFVNNGTSSGAKIMIAKSGSSLWIDVSKFDSTGGTTGSAGARFYPIAVRNAYRRESFALYGDYLYMTNGVNGLMRWDGTFYCNGQVKCDGRKVTGSGTNFLASAVEPGDRISFTNGKDLNPYSGWSYPFTIGANITATALYLKGIYTSASFGTYSKYMISRARPVGMKWIDYYDNVYAVATKSTSAQYSISGTVIKYGWHPVHDWTEDGYPHANWTTRHDIVMGSYATAGTGTYPIPMMGTGTYRYVVTMYDKRYGYESDPCTSTAIKIGSSTANGVYAHIGLPGAGAITGIENCKDIFRESLNYGEPSQLNVYRSMKNTVTPLYKLPELYGEAYRTTGYIPTSSGTITVGGDTLAILNPGCIGVELSENNYQYIQYYNTATTGGKSVFTTLSMHNAIHTGSKVWCATPHFCKWDKAIGTSGILPTGSYVINPWFVDFIPDNQLTANSAEWGHDMPTSTMKYIRTFNSRLYGYGADNVLRMSAMNHPEYWSMNQYGTSDSVTDNWAGGYYLSGDSTQKIISVVPEGGAFNDTGKAGYNLLVFTKDRAFRWIGMSWTDFAVVDAFNDTCLANDAVTNAQGRVIWLSRRGLVFIQTGGNGIEPIYLKPFPSNKNPFSKVADLELAENATAQVWKDYYILAYASEGSTVNDKVLIYHIPTNTFTTLSNASNKLNISDFAIDDDDDKLYYGSSVGSNIYELNPESANSYWTGTTGVACSFTTQMITGNDASSQDAKEVKEVWVCYNTPTSDQTLNMQVLVNGKQSGDVLTKTLSASGDDDRKWVCYHTNVHTWGFQLKFYGTFTEPITIQRIDIHYVGRGQLNR